MDQTEQIDACMDMDISDAGKLLACLPHNFQAKADTISRMAIDFLSTHAASLFDAFFA
jgi:hypothetical protein